MSPKKPANVARVNHPLFSSRLRLPPPSLPLRDEGGGGTGTPFEPSPEAAIAAAAAAAAALVPGRAGPAPALPSL